MFFEYGSLRVFYERSGSGQQSILLLHGWGCTHSVWDAIVPLLAEKYSVYALDLPGFGESSEPDSVWGVEEYTKMVEAFADSTGLESPSLISHSFGGRISILYASRRSVTRLVLTDAAGLKPHRTLSYYLKVYSYKALKFFCLKVLRSEQTLRRLRPSAGSADYRNASPRMKAVLSRTVNEDLRKYLPLIKAPTLLFWGTLDTATPLSDAREMERRIPDAGLVTVEGGSHFSFLEAPALYASVLKSFFEL